MEVLVEEVLMEEVLVVMKEVPEEMEEVLGC